MSTFKAGLLAVVAATALIGVKPANATFYAFYTTNGGASYAIVPGSPAPDGASISVSGGTAGGISTINSTFTNNAPNPGTTSSSFTNSTQINATSTSGGGITFAIVENDFQGPTAAPLVLTNSVTLIPNMSGSSGSTLSQTSCVLGGSVAVTTANVGSLCGTSLAITAPASVTTTTLAMSANTAAPIASLTSPFTTVEYFTLLLSAGANVLAQGSTTVSSVPEPMSLALVGTGLVGMGLVRRKRQGG